MGKGDKKSRKGKIAMGSHGVLRPRKKVKAKTAAAKKATAPSKKNIAAVATPAKKSAATAKVAAPKKAAAPKKVAPKKAE